MELDDSDDEEFTEPSWKSRRITKADSAAPSPHASRQAQEDDRCGPICAALREHGDPHAGLCLHLPPGLDEADDPYTLCTEERSSADYLHRRWVTFAQLDGQSTDQKTITLGAYVQGPLAGLQALAYDDEVTQCSCSHHGRQPSKDDIIPCEEYGDGPSRGLQTTPTRRTCSARTDRLRVPCHFAVSEL